MDLQKFDSWLSILTNIGVLIGIVLLVIEINQNNEITRVLIEQQRADSSVATFRDMAEGDHLAPLFARITSFPENTDLATILKKLSAEEQTRLRAFVAARFADYENTYFQHKRGFISESAWQEGAVPGISFWAPQWKILFPPRGPNGRQEFKDEVDRILGSGITLEHR